MEGFIKPVCTSRTVQWLSWIYLYSSLTTHAGPLFLDFEYCLTLEHYISVYSIVSNLSYFILNTYNITPQKGFDDQYQKEQNLVSRLLY